MNAISKIKNTVVIIILSVMLLSCENNVEEDVIALCDPDISFTASIRPIIDNNCIICHGGNQAPDFRTFDGVNNNASRIRTQVLSRRMPLVGSLTDQEIELIRCWIDNGALNN